MKNIQRIFSLLLMAMFITVSCVDDDQELGKMPDPSSINFDVTQDYTIDAGGNTVILKNNTQGIEPIWDYGTGRSTRQQDTIHFAFKGNYDIRLSVVTKGGIMAVDTVTVEVTADNLNYVSGDLWEFLTGGIGESKTWILDNGKYGLASGPLSYADPGVTQDWENFKPNWEPGPSDVGATANDLAAEMTFNLQGGPYITTVKPNESGGNESGTFFLNTTTHTLSTTDATIVRLASFIPNASNWNANLKILKLTENQLRIAVYRTNSEGPWWYIFNYVSKEYAENYVPAFVPDPNFDLGDQLQILAGNSATTWKLSTATPFNWTNLLGFNVYNWYSIADYPDTTGYDAATVADIENVRLTFYRTGDVELLLNDGSTEHGLFSVNEPKNLITFQLFTPAIPLTNKYTATTTSYYEDGSGNVITGENQWKLVRTRSVSGVITEIWVGKREIAESRYMVYHFVLANGVPDVTRAMIRGLCGGITGTSSKTFKIDTNWPVDWVNPEGTGWTVAGTQDGWYWNADIAASVKNQTLTFTQNEGVVTVTKKDETGAISTSPVTIDGTTRRIIIPDTNIIQFGAGSWLPTAGPEYYWMRGDFGETEGMWIGHKNSATEYVVYHYILK